MTAPKERLRAKNRRANAAALRFLAKLPDSDPERITVTGALKALRAAVSASLPSGVRSALVVEITRRLANEFRDLKLKPPDFGSETFEELAEAYVRMMERAKVADYSPQELRAVAAGAYRRDGLRGNFAGELFEQLVRNMKELREDLERLARTQLAELEAAAAAGRLLDGDGKRLPAGGVFTEIVRVTDVVDAYQRENPEFIDTANVAIFLPADGGEPMLAILTETEIKMPTAAKKLPAQIAKALGRFSTTGGIEVKFEGHTDPTPYLRKNLIFGQTLMGRTGVKPMKRPGTSYRWLDTDKAGYPQGYMRIGVAIDVDELYRLVNLLFRK